MAAEKMGIFWPCTMEFMVLIAEMPVWSMAFGKLREKGLMSMPLMSR